MLSSENTNFQQLCLLQLASNNTGEWSTIPQIRKKNSVVVAKQFQISRRSPITREVKPQNQRKSNNAAQFLTLHDRHLTTRHAGSLSNSNSCHSAAGRLYCGPRHSLAC